MSVGHTSASFTLTHKTIASHVPDVTSRVAIPIIEKAGELVLVFAERVVECEIG
jgi:hypothetical protein